MMEIFEWIRLILGAALLISGLIIFLVELFGVFRMNYVLNRMHAAALGDTLGILFMILGLAIWRGLGFASFKLLLVVLFFWLASPVAGHMISRLEVMTDEDLGEIEVEHREDI